MNRSPVLLGVLGSLILALGIGQFLTFQRLRKLELRLTSTEVASSAPASPSVTVNAPDPSSSFTTDRSGIPATPTPTSTPAPAPASTLSPAPHSVAPASAASSRPVNTTEVEEIVNRILKERDKKHPFGDLFSIEMADPMQVMEQELNLSPAQKLRIEEHRKNREAAFEELMSGAAPLADPKSFGEKSEAIENHYVASVKGELDYEQAKKYDELRNSGKLMDYGGSGSHARTIIMSTSPPSTPDK